MMIFLFFVSIALARASGDAPPIPYAATSPSASQSSSFAGDQIQDRIQGISDSYGDHFDSSNGFNVQSGYEGYLIPASEHSILSFVDGFDLKTHHGFFFRLLKTIVYVASKVIPKVATGALVLVGLFLLGGCVNALICTFTPFCTISFAGFGVTKDTMRSYLNPDRISTTAALVIDAIKRYQDMYESNEVDSEKKIKS